MATKNEVTSKRVAAKAGKLLRTCNRVEKLLSELLEQARSVAGSALTQAPNRRKRVP